MGIKFQIRARRECQKCHGSGIIDHPLWSEFYAFVRTNPEAWWIDRGYAPTQLPPEEIECDECDGTGYVEFWLDVAEVQQ